MINARLMNLAEFFPGVQNCLTLVQMLTLELMLDFKNRRISETLYLGKLMMLRELQEELQKNHEY